MSNPDVSLWGIGQAEGGKVLSGVDGSHASHPSCSASNWSNFLSVDRIGSASMNQDGFRLELGEVYAANFLILVGMVTHSKGFNR